MHIPGKNIPAADKLSRKFIPAEPEDSNFVKDLDVQVHRLFNNMPMPPQTTPQIQELQQTILEGWPELCQNCKSTVSEFLNFRNQLSNLDGIIKGEKILVPASLRPEMIQKIHSSHLGIRDKAEGPKDPFLAWHGNANTQCYRCLLHLRCNKTLQSKTTSYAP